MKNFILTLFIFIPFNIFSMENQEIICSLDTLIKLTTADDLEIIAKKTKFVLLSVFMALKIAHPKSRLTLPKDVIEELKRYSIMDAEERFYYPETLREILSDKVFVQKLRDLATLNNFEKDNNNLKLSLE